MTPRLFETLEVGLLGVNCYLVGDGETRDAVCIDPGDEADRILEAIERHGLRVKAILATHAHADHISAAPAVKAGTGVPVWAPDGEQELWRTAAELIALFGVRMPQPDDPDAWLHAGEHVSAGTVGIDVLDVCGHSPGGVAYRIGDMAFVGDTLFRCGIGRTDLPGGDSATLVDRIKRSILSLPPETVVYPGHGPQTSVAEEMRRNPFVR